MKDLEQKILLLFLLVVTGCSKNTEVIDTILFVKDRWVPDKREGVYNIKSTQIKGNTYIIEGETNIPEAKEELIKVLNGKGYIIQDSIRIIPYKLPKHFALTSLSVINLRTEPSHTAELSNQALMGTPLKILKIEDGWYYVQTPDKYLAWCEEDVVTLRDSTEMASWRNSQRIIVTNTIDFILDSAQNKRISDVVEGCVLQKLSEKDEKIQVLMPDGRKGVLSQNAVLNFNKWASLSVTDSSSLVPTALSMLGLPYLWGANSSKALDCSGFTKTVYFLNGIILSRDASLQVNHGDTIQISDNCINYRAGDLLFFGKPKHITHVGMFIGDAEYIHSAGQVKINSLDSTKNNYSKYRANTLQAVRRITGSEKTEGIIPVEKHPWYFND